MERSLVERAQRGDREAYEALAAGAVRRLYLTAHRIVRDPDQAEEATQQALIAIWERLPSLRDPDRFEAWTYRLVVRFCLSDRRRQRRVGVRHVTLEEGMATVGDGAADVGLRDQLSRALAGLSVEHRTVVVLHHYAGLPIGEIAEILGIPYGTVGSRLHHAKRSLRASLSAADDSLAAEGQPA